MPCGDVGNLIFNAVCGVACRCSNSLGPRVRTRLGHFSTSLSPFGSASIVSHIGQGRSVVASDFFRAYFGHSVRVSGRASNTFSVAVTPLTGT